MALASLEIKFNGHKATANKRLLFVCSLVGRGLTLGIHPDPAGDPDPRNSCSLFLWKSKKSRAQLWNYFNFVRIYLCRKPKAKDPRRQTGCTSSTGLHGSTMLISGNWPRCQRIGNF